MLHQIFNVLSIGIRPALAGIHVMLQSRAKRGQFLLSPALAGIRVMLLCRLKARHLKAQPALAGIRVMLQFVLAKIKNAQIACISRYSCNVTQNNTPKFLVKGACISRYSCNVTAEAYLLPLSASLIKSCEACFK